MTKHGTMTNCYEKMTENTVQILISRNQSILKLQENTFLTGLTDLWRNRLKSNAVGFCCKITEKNI
jgi:hypothetical protein